MAPRLSVMVALVVALTVAATSAVVPPQWENIGVADSLSRVRIAFALKQDGEEWLRQTFVQVSDPSSSSYARYVDHETLAKMVHGAPDAVRHVTSLLRNHGIDYTLTRDQSYVMTEMSVTEASQLLATTFFVYRHRFNNSTVIRTPMESLPTTFGDHVVLAVGHNTFPYERRLGARRSSNLGTTPASIDAAYKLNGYTSTNGDNKQAVASFLKQYFNPNDLAHFQSQFKLPNRPIDKVVGPNTPAFAGAEASLDVQYIGATGRNISTWFVSTAQEANHGQEDFLYWITGQINDTTSPYVHSVSYGDVETSIPIDYKTRVDLEFQKFGVLGRTIFIAAGDSGVGCNPDHTFQPDWPTSSPYVTSVGGSTGQPETTWSDGGGGFSNTYGQPEWQTAAVNAYLNSGQAPATKYFNASGRAYPDVAAFATNFEIVMHGATLGVDGTSCATPTFAGVVSALNDVRMGAGKAPLGFINPLLYTLGASHPEAFNDITTGSNPNLQCPGFRAIKGWDPATGWGSPNFSTLRNLVLQLQ